ncbi:MAG: integrase family protein [Roseovarius sp.]
MRLTDLSIQKLPIPAKGQKTYWENGFGVRVSQGGSKSFVLMSGKERRLTTIGKYPAISLKEARQAAKRLQVTDTPIKGKTTLCAAREDYLRECERKNRPATVYNYRLYLSELDKPFLSDVTRTDVPNTDSHRVTAWKVFFNWCVRHELVDRNPFAFSHVKYNSRERVLSDDELKAIWHYNHPPYSDYLKLLILTGQRRGQFQKYELRGDTLFFPAEIMKSKVDHMIPATPLVLELVGRLEPFNGWSKAKARCDKRTGVTGWTVHDARRTFSTKNAALGTPIHVVV